MKIILSGDLHLNRTFPSSVSYERVASHNKVFDDMVKYAINNNIDGILCSGDLFDVKTPWAKVVSFVKDRLYRLQDAGKFFVTIRGNHDGSGDHEAIKKGVSIERVSFPKLNGYHIIDPVVDLNRKNDKVGYRIINDDLAIFGCGYHGKRTLDVFKKYITRDKIKNVKDSVSSNALVVLLLHCFVEDVNNIGIPMGADFVFPIDEIAGLGFDVCLVGHYHGLVKPKKINNTIFLSSGSPEKFNFHQTHSGGFYVMNVDDKNSLTFKFVHVKPLYKMENVVINSDKPRSMSWFLDGAKNSLSSIKHESKGLILNVVLKGLTNEKIDRRYILDELSKVRDDVIYLDVNNKVTLDNLLDGKNSLVEVNVADSLVLELMRAHLDEEHAMLLLSAYNETRKFIDDDSNLTKSGNLKKDARNELKERIKSLLCTTIIKKKIENTTTGVIKKESREKNTVKHRGKKTRNNKIKGSVLHYV